MKIHFFQRYHSKENVDTANAMLLLSRLYAYSSSKFFTFLGRILPENASVELLFNLQERSTSSVPDATITQASFKVVVETKLYGDFLLGQLVHHLQSFTNEDYKVLLTIDPNPMTIKMTEGVGLAISKHNAGHQSNVIHKHLSFEEIINAVNEVIDERDYEMKDVLDDFREYCYSSGLIPDDWKRMRVQLAGTTININKDLNLYYDNIERGFSGHKFLGLYNQKVVRAIGEIIAIVSTAPIGGSLEFSIEKGILTDDMRARIKIATEDAKKYGYNLGDPTRYFFVDRFYETNFEKATPYAPRGSRMFDLCEVLGLTNLPNTEKIAELLRQKQWS
jgi:hypothetical protein